MASSPKYKRGAGPAATLFANGFDKELLSVIPPGAKLSPYTQIQPEQLGKVPGIMGKFGWRGTDWIPSIGESGVEEIDKLGANVGLITTRILPIDIDCDNTAFHKPLIELAHKHFPNAPIRWGKRPLVMLRLKGPCKIGRYSMRFKDAAGDRQLVESFHGATKQFVIAGTHPSGIKFRTEPALKDLFFEDIPEATEAQVMAWYDAAEKLLKSKAHGCTEFNDRNKRNTGEAKHSDERPINAEELAISVEDYRKALHAIPNEKGRDRMVGIVHAAKGASLLYPEEGWRILRDEWVAKRTDGSDGPNEKEVAKVWRDAGRATNGVRAGGMALFERAGMPWARAQREFAMEKKREVEARKIEAGEPTFTLVSALSQTTADPNWLMRGIFPDGVWLGVLHGEPGSNKSTLATGMAVHMAVGLPFGHEGKHGVPKPVKSVLISEEDKTVMVRRVHAWRLWLEENRIKDLPKNWKELLEQNLLTISERFGNMDSSAAAFIEAAQANVKATGTPIGMIWVDTLARTFVSGGDENEGKSMNQYMDYTEQVSADLECPVMLIHHPAKGTGAMRGHSSLKGALSVELKVVRSETTVNLYCDKMREAAAFKPLSFRVFPHEYRAGVHFDETMDVLDREYATALLFEPVEFAEEISSKTRSKNSQLTEEHFLEVAESNLDNLLYAVLCSDRFTPSGYVEQSRRDGITPVPQVRTVRKAIAMLEQSGFIKGVGAPTSPRRHYIGTAAGLAMYEAKYEPIPEEDLGEIEGAHDHGMLD